MNRHRLGARLPAALALLVAVLDAGCSGSGEPAGEATAEALGGSCSFSVTQNTYDGPNYWGTVTVKNDGPSAATGYSVAFDVPSGVHCTNDTVPPGATLSPLNGSGSSAATKSNHCVFTWASAKLAAGASATFNYSTDSTSFKVASNVVASSASCSNADAGTSGSDGGHDAGDGATAPRDGSPEGSSGSCAQYLGSTPASAWVYSDANGKLKYKPLDANGDTIMDFSSAGYMGGGVAIPTVPVQKTIGPSGGDDTSAVQAAIDAVSALPLQNGVRGAVLLKPGKYTLAGSIHINASGVVLRGSGTGPTGTVVTVQSSADFVLRIAGSGGAVVGSQTATITDSYVPSGASSFHVSDASPFAKGDTVFVQRPVTSAWVAFMGMNGLTNTWIAPGTVHQWDRVVTSVTGNQIAIDAPISDSIDSKYVTGASIAKFTYPGRISQVGLEDIEFDSPARSATSQFLFVRVDSVVDGWIRNVVDHDFTNGIWLGPGVKRFTVADTTVTHDATSYVTSAAPFDFWIDGQQTLVMRSSSAGGNKIWYYATQKDARGPNVLLDFTGTGTTSHVTGHVKWATGALVDGARVTGGITFGNNGDLGSGEGWSMGWGVIWNSVSDVGVMAPPGGMNWAIGNTGNELDTTAPVGTYESMNTPIGIKSLYLAQLCERLGPAAVAAISK
jgi:hypothetical protein